MTAHRIAALKLELAQLEHEQAHTAWHAALDRYMTEAKTGGLSVAEVTASKAMHETRATLQAATGALDAARAEARALGVPPVSAPVPETPTPTASRPKPTGRKQS